MFGYFILHEHSKHTRKSFSQEIYRVIHKSVKHFKNSRQINYASDHGNSYVDRE
jgi:hypothetical protein